MIGLNSGMRIGLVVVIVGSILSVGGYMLTTRNLANANTKNHTNNTTILENMDKKVDGLIYYEISGDKEILKELIID